MLLGTSMDYESADSRSKGCWDPKTVLSPFYEKWCSPTPTPDFVVDDVWCGMVGSIGFGAAATPEVAAYWTETLKAVYRGDEGRKKLKVALVNLLERDGLLLRLRDITCPVVWLQVCFLRSLVFLGPAGRRLDANRGTPSGHRRCAVRHDDPQGADRVVHLVEGGDAGLH